MNELANLNSGVFSVFGASVAGLGTPVLPGAQPMDGQFQDILGLVNDMSIADEQSGVLNDTVEDGAQELMTNSSLAHTQLAAMQSVLGPQMQSSQAASPTQATLIVGQSEAQVAPIETQSLQAFSELSFNSKKEALQGQPIQASMEQWAAAIANGDITKVGIEKSAVEGTVTKSPMPTEQVLKLATPDQGFATQESAALGPEMAKLSKVEAKVGSQVGESSERSGFSKAVLPQVQVGVNVVKNSEQESQSNSSGKRDSKSNGEKKGISMSGTDFLLQQSASTPTDSAKESSAVLIGGASLGEMSDRRISPESLNFVAERVDALKAQGGGTLRVDLNPRDLGGIQIKVSMVKSGMKVELLAERPETIQALQASKGDLSLKLNAISPTKLEMGVARDLPQVASEKLAKVTGSVASSQEMLNLRGNEGLKQATHSADSANKIQPDFRDFAKVSESSVATADSSARPDFSSNSGGNMNSKQEADSEQSRFGQGWNRDERREKAQNRWEEFLDGHRKSA